MSLLYELQGTDANRGAKPVGTPCQTEYVTGQVPAGGPVRISASPLVLRVRAWLTASPGIDTDDLDGARSTGRRPICSMELTASARAMRPGETRRAAGWPQRSRTTGAKAAAVAGGTNRTLAEGPMDVHRTLVPSREPE